MKKWVVLGLAIVLAAGALWQNIYLRQFSDELCVAADSMARAVENRDEKAAAKAAAELHGAWNTYEPHLGSLVEHDEIDKLYAELLRVENGIYDDNFDELSGDIAQLRYYIAHIADIDSFSIKNIF